MLSKLLKILLCILFIILVSCKKEEIVIEDNTENTTIPEVIDNTPKEK